VTSSARTAKTDPVRRRRARRGEGDRLREEVLAAARDLLAETGSETAVSIRAVADRVGVTPPSIYLHFPDKEALLDSVCVEVFTRLDAAMEAAAEGAPTPFEGLRERGLAYVRFAIENPEHYRLVLMRRHDLGIGPTDMEQLAAQGAFAHIVDSVRACQEIGVFVADEDPIQVALALWSAAHGVAALLIAHPWLVGDEAEALISRVIDSIGVGLAIRGRIDEGDAPDLLTQLDRQRAP
jgi:AcrR family transcriptional regulator